ncbi:MAG: hypothetical protein HYY23_04995 [Verrucomicrobia bacterium]|nr:hypothetical protein [Verrucomicrobiota bacterium]
MKSLNALIRKEIRLILPAWVAAMILAATPVWLFSVTDFFNWQSPGVAMVLTSLALGAILLGLAPFGQECSVGTLSLLLAQPVARRQIWRAKIAVITAALILVFACLMLSFLIRIRGVPSSGEVFDLLKFGGLAAVVAVTGGLWTTLLFRQVAASVWFTLLAPLFLLTVTAKFWDRFSEGVATVGVTAMLVLYSIAGFCWARRMFLRAQDTAWTGGTLSLPAWLRFTIGKASAVRKTKRKPIRAFLRKEFHAHHLSLLIAAGLLFLHLIVVAIRRLELEMDPTDPHPAFRALLEFWWVLWLGLPFLVGSASVAEERKLGTLEAQLCLPMTRRAQFAIKLGLTLVLGVFLGGLMPWAAEGVGGFDTVPGAFREARRAIPSLWQPLGLTCLIAAAITLLSFYASTLRRSLLNAMGTAVIFGFALMAIGGWIINAAIDYRHPPPWGIPLIIYIGGPLILAALIWLAFTNYKYVQLGWKMWLRNALTIVLTLVFAFTVTATIYRRSWELFMTLEPRHGPAQFSGPVRPKICSTGGRKLFALLPDGRLWAAGQYEIRGLDKYVETHHRVDGVEGPITWEKLRWPVPVDGIFVGNSNWIALASTSTRVVGIQSDGSLWRVFSQPTAAWHPRNLSDIPEPERIGTDLDWKTVAGGHGHFLALKKDGTLWGWRSHQPGERGVGFDEVPDEPIRIGADSDWVSVFASQHDSIGIKRDGSVWGGVGPELGRDLRKGWDPGPYPNPVQWNLDGSSWRVFSRLGLSDLVLQQDGSLWAAGQLPHYLLGVRINRGFSPEPLRVSRGSDWVDVAPHFDSLAAINKKGELYLQSLNGGSVFWPGNLRKPSKYSDWLAVGNCGWQELAALAADGTLCVWSEPFRTQGLLGPTRKPLWSINIFGR